MSARPSLTAPDDDPLLWLEEVDGARVLAWVEAQNGQTLARFGGDGWEADRTVLAAIYDRPDKIPFVTRRGGLIYNFWKDAANPRGLWRRTTLESFRSPAPDWDVLLDVDALAGSEDEDWIWAGAQTLAPNHDRAIVRLSRGGSDAVVLREFDLDERCFDEGGFRLPEAKGGVEWLDCDTLLLSSAHGDDRATRSGYSRTIRLWRRGTTAEAADTIFETEFGNLGVWGQRDVTGDAERLWFVERLGFFSSALWIGDRSGAKTRLDVPEESWSSAWDDWLAVCPRSDWTVGGNTHRAGTLLGIRLSAFLAGDRTFQLLFQPGERRAAQNFLWSGGRLVVSILDDLRPVFDVLSPSDGNWTSTPLPGLPDIGIANVWRLDADVNEGTGELLLNAQDPLTPPTLSLVERGKAPQLLRRAPSTFDADGLSVRRHEAVSEDGTRIPYVVTGPADETGEAPVHVTGYGGFQIPQLPVYNASVGKLWLERGGTSVVAQIRGGGEFGPDWHQAGKREGKALTHSDFAAVAADLVDRGITRADRIAAEGGSNGGLLIANMLTRYPERFGALFCTIPLIDMRRYAKLHAGASWIAEYGDPDKPEDWHFLQHLSAYHTARPEQSYPPILLATARRDDRVHPGHARKMAAKLQAMGYQAWFYEPAAGGHGYGKDNAELAGFVALGYRFLRDRIGWNPPE